MISSIQDVANVADKLYQKAGEFSQAGDDRGAVLYSLAAATLQRLASDYEAATGGDEEELPAPDLRRLV